MKTRIIGLVLAFALAACSTDLKDANTTVQNQQSEANITIDLRVSGTMVSARSDASANELAVNNYDLYIFDVSTGLLQHFEQGITPALNETLTGSKDLRIGKHEITLPTTGAKEIFAIANPSSALYLPTLTIDDGTGEAGTSIDDFRQLVSISLVEGAMPATPLLMTGATSISTSNDITAPVTLHRTVAKLDVCNMATSAITLTSLTLKKVASTYAPFAEEQQPKTVDYAAITEFASGENAIDDKIYLLPTPTNTLIVDLKGTVNGKDFAEEIIVGSQFYADYDYKLLTTVRGGKVAISVAPDFSGIEVKPIELSGDWLSGTAEVTLPFTAEPHYGFTVDYILNIDGTATLKRSGSEDWFSAELEGENKIRFRTLKDNTGADRTATVALAVGGTELTINIKQQGLQNVKTHTFRGLEWMDRNIGATLVANAGNANNKRSWGYYYQWGRNIPFPVDGDVETVSTQMTPTEANASTKFIAYSGGTEDWNSMGIQGNQETYWESVSANPCPEGWRLPTYEELTWVMLHRNNALVFASAQQKTADQHFIDGAFSTSAYVGYASGAIKEPTEKMQNFGIKFKGTDQAYHIRTTWTNIGGELTSTMPSYPNHVDDIQSYMSGGQNVLRIDRIPANAAATWSKRNDAIAFWDENNNHPDMETLIFPCAGRRNASGELENVATCAFYWSGSMFTQHPDNAVSKIAEKYASGLIYFRPAGRFIFHLAPAVGTAQVHANTECLGYRNQGMPIRCVRAAK